MPQPGRLFDARTLIGGKRFGVDCGGISKHLEFVSQPRNIDGDEAISRKKHVPFGVYRLGAAVDNIVSLPFAVFPVEDDLALLAGRLGNLSLGGDPNVVIAFGIPALRTDLSLDRLERCSGGRRLCRCRHWQRTARHQNRQTRIAHLCLLFQSPRSAEPSCHQQRRR